MTGTDNSSLGVVNPKFWKDKRVFLTGHTGFKGSWLTLWLASMGAKVTGYALVPNTSPNLYNVLSLDGLIEKSHISDIRNLGSLQKAMHDADPEIVIHMAAQPLVRYSYENPIETYAVNVMGTAHVLEAARSISSIRATVIVTTDKCYENREWDKGYVEEDAMGGYDPYSSSKGCAELVTAAYRRSFFSEHPNAIASARAGNVIGGGDWSADRIIPDAIKAFESQQPLLIRNPNAIRPWQHVLEPLSGYLVLAQALYENGAAFEGAWNFGPDDKDARSVKEVVNILIQSWKNEASWKQDGSPQPHEANFLKLNCNKAKQELCWTPKWSLEEAIDSIARWNAGFTKKGDMRTFSLGQINSYLLTKSAV